MRAIYDSVDEPLIERGGHLRRYLIRAIFVLVIPKHHGTLAKTKLGRVQAVIVSGAIIHDRHQTIGDVRTELVPFGERRLYEPVLWWDAGPDAENRVTIDSGSAES